MRKKRRTIQLTKFQMFKVKGGDGAGGCTPPDPPASSDEDKE